MTKLFDSIGNSEFFKWYGDIRVKAMVWEFWERLNHLALENAMITADEYQHNWLNCHELKLYGG